jgi:hypothetical protein
MAPLTAKSFAEQASRCFDMAAEASNESVAKTLREMGAKLLELAHHDAALDGVPNDTPSTVVI